MRTLDQIIKELPLERQTAVKARTEALTAQAKPAMQKQKQADEKEIRTYRPLHGR